MSYKVRIFSKIDENVFLFVPIFLLILALAFQILGYHSISEPNLNWVKIAVLIFGLQTAHNAFTFSAMFLPEFRLWLKEKKEFENRRLILRWFMVGIFLASAFAGSCLLSTSYKDFWTREIFGEIKTWQFFWFFFWIFNFWHATSQFYGLSMMYNRAYQADKTASGAECKLLAVAESWERKIYRPLLILATLALSIAATFELKSGVVLLLTSILVGISVLLFLPTLFYPAPLRRAKLLFNLRLFLMPVFARSSLTASFGLNITHNTEYLMVYRKMLMRSKIKYLSIFATLSAAWILFAIAVSLAKFPFAGLQKFMDAHPIQGAILFTFAMTLTTLHYFIDGDLFRFSDQLTRKHIGPLR